ncbi:TonB-dependent siderophore receptor [Novosphingobium resinovorum]|uniref:TonB-dependent receptor n=1 Tax=Novosphingobium resinovorum TaxID=158500 RepID=A0A1D8A2X8_9SPHN|nr:TonB-dependent receptor [Novosphingobium resinovorum]AOR76416.1 TonB-dependent receptor [Novosphingobium resinovorum]
MHKRSIIRSTLVAGASILSTVIATSAYAQSAVEDNKAQDIVVTGLRQAYIGDMPVQDIPQNIQSIDGAKLQGLGLTRLDTALDLVSGVAHLNNFGGLWDGYAIRGFAGDANNVPTGFLVNGFNARGFSGPRDASSVERIDVLKGSTSAMFGRGEPGGTVNIVTKKPEFTAKGNVQVQAGSWNNYRVDADYTTPLSDNLAVRLNGAYENSDSYRDTVHSEKIFITPSILAKLGDSTTVSYELEFASLKVPFDRGIPIFNNDFTRLPASRYLGEPGDGPMKADNLGHQLQLQHDFNDNWSMLAGVSYRTTHLRGIGEVPELVAGRQPFLQSGATAGTLLSRQRRYHNFKSENFIARAELTGHFDVAGLANTLVVGADYDYFKLDQLQTRFRPAAYTGQSNAAINAIDVLNPVYGAYPSVNASASLVYDQLEQDYAWGTYFYDQVDLTSWLKIRAGGRYDEFRQHFLKRNTGVLLTQTVTKFSPQGGVVLQPTDTLSFYGTYGQGFRPNNGASVQGDTFQPETSKSYEVGAKYISPDKKITASVALFNMKKTNILTADPANSGYVIAVGSAKSRGVEFDLNAQLPFGFNLMVAYAYTDAFWTAEFSDPDFAKPILPGDPLIGIPKHSGNAMLTKDFMIGDDHKATIGAGVQYIDKRLGETATDYYLPSATLVRVIGSVDLTDKITVSGNIDNLFNKRWFANSYSALWTYPGAPRSFSVRANYRF